jgi:hypothetical protein
MLACHNPLAAQYVQAFKFQPTSSTNLLFSSYCTVTMIVDVTTQGAKARLETFVATWCEKAFQHVGRLSRCIHQDQEDLERHSSVDSTTDSNFDVAGDQDTLINFIMMSVQPDPVAPQGSMGSTSTAGSSTPRAHSLPESPNPIPDTPESVTDPDSEVAEKHSHTGYKALHKMMAAVSKCKAATAAALKVTKPRFA